MSGKGKKAASPSGSKLQPTVLHDSLGAYITVTCGSLSGNLYLSRLDASNKSQSKCVVVSGKWYTPSDFETLAGKKARKWRQSLHHQGKPLSLYLLSSLLDTQGSSQGDLSAGSQDVDLTRSTPVSGHVPSQPNVAESSHSSVRLVSVSTSCDTFIVDALLSFVKAYCLKGDKNSLKVKLCEHFSGGSISSAKKLLWDSCALPLRSLHLPYQQRRDSDKHKQLTADIEDLLLAFDALDTNNSIPPIYCEAGELYKLPPISLDPVAEQVEKNSQVLNDLTSAVQCFRV